jgi:uncharacterized LabA/DUF88 family protein
MRYEKEKPFSSDCDVLITVDAMQWLPEFDVFYLVSGDGDYIPLLNQISYRDKRIEVITFEQSVSHKLYAAADRITYLSEEQVFKDNR